MLRSNLSSSFAVLLAGALPACAARPAAPVVCPPCTQQARAPEPPAAPPAVASFSAPEEPEYVALQLFVLDTQRTRTPPGAAEAPAAALPKDVWAAAGCEQHPCRLVSAPTLLGHRRSPMRLEVGNLAQDQRLSFEAQGRSRTNAIDLQFVASLSDGAGRYRMEFSGSVAPGGITHLGTVGREGNGAHEVYAITAHGDAKDAVEQLAPWRPETE